MRVLVVGANGFIGAAIVTALARAGIAVRGVVRAADKFASRFPEAEPVEMDLRHPSAQNPDTWKSVLAGVDAVVNAAGVLQPRREGDAWAVHDLAPDALFAACEVAGIKRVIQISAVGIEEGRTVFARSKRSGDEKLMARDLHWTVLRPTVVVGDGSYGGSSMLRAIAAFPLVTPVIGDGETPLDFIHTNDLAHAIVGLLQTDGAKKAILEPASGANLSLTQSVQAYRRWLGLAPAPVLKIPQGIVKSIARLGDWVKLDPITTTAVAQFDTRLTGDATEFAAATGIKVRTLGEILSGRPAGVQDLWHARLYLVRPLVRLSLAVLWLASGLLGLFADPSVYASILESLTRDSGVLSFVAIGTSVIDLVIAGALIVGWRLKEFAYLQLAMVLGYTVTLTILAPYLWGDLFGGVLKNVPILALILIHRVLEEER